MLIFDIETKPSSVEELKQIFTPTKELYEPTKWDESTFKKGRLVDEEKIAAKKLKDKEKHEAAEKEKAEKAKTAIANEWSEFVDKAAVNAQTCEVMAVAYYGMKSKASYFQIAGEEVPDVADRVYTEETILADFWMNVADRRDKGEAVVGVNINDFDLPMIVRRSWAIGVMVPDWAFVLKGGKIYWDNVFFDLRAIYLLGQHWGNRKSDFDTLAKLFGTDGKPDSGVEGATWWREWLEGDREKAGEYIYQDVYQPSIWVQKMGLWIEDGGDKPNVNLNEL